MLSMGIAFQERRSEDLLASGKMGSKERLENGEIQNSSIYNGLEMKQQDHPVWHRHECQVGGEGFPGLKCHIYRSLNDFGFFFFVFFYEDSRFQ